ncbi:MAG: hypothetical protein ABUS79_03165, partial [Pseudomonadota bacterium]
MKAAGGGLAGFALKLRERGDGASVRGHGRGQSHETGTGTAGEHRPFSASGLALPVGAGGDERDADGPGRARQPAVAPSGDAPPSPAHGAAFSDEGGFAAVLARNLNAQDAVLPAVGKAALPADVAPHRAADPVAFGTPANVHVRFDGDGDGAGVVGRVDDGFERLSSATANSGTLGHTGDAERAPAFAASPQRDGARADAAPQAPTATQAPTASQAATASQAVTAPRAPTNSEAPTASQ